MPLTRTKFYSFTGVALSVGYVWLGYNQWAGAGQTPEVCLFKIATGYPCPSCGSTRSVHALLQAHWFQAMQWNPLGYVIASFLLVAPIWMLSDRLQHSASMYKAYQWVEQQLTKKQYAIPLILLVLANWIWNILKGN